MSHTADTTNPHIATGIRRLSLLVAALTAAFVTAALTSTTASAAVTPTKTYYDAGTGRCYVPMPGGLGTGLAPATITSPAQGLRNAANVAVTLRMFAAVVDDYGNPRTTWSWVGDRNVDPGQVAYFPSVTLNIPYRSVSSAFNARIQVLVELWWQGQVYETSFGTSNWYAKYQNGSYGSGPAFAGWTSVC